MKSVDRLKTEHDIIERVLGLLERTVARIDSSQPVPSDFPQWAAQFFGQFADQCHHAKEEDLLFPLLKDRGIPQEGGPIGVMLHEHEVGRDCVRRMKGAAEADPFDSGTFAAAAREYIPLLREHIFKENNVLFQMAENAMSESDDTDLDARFDQVEQQRGHSGLHQRYESEVSQWEKSLP